MIVDCAVYDDGVRRDGSLPLDHALEAAGEPGALVWIGLHEPSAEEFEKVAAEFELHPLLVEDLLHAHQRPKIEVFDDTLLMVLKTADFVEQDQAVRFAELLLVAGPGFVVSVRHGDASELASVRRQLEHSPDLIKCGPSAVLHAVCDRVVDEYEPVLDAVEEEVEGVEDEVFSPDRGNSAQRIYRLKREVLSMYRATAPLLDAIDPLVKASVPHSHEDLREYFRDVADHLTRVVGRIEVAREMLSDALDANLAQISVRQNEDMRTISAWAAVIAVPTMLAGVWGMNFQNMPELDWDLGYLFALGTIVLAAFTVHRLLKRSGWL